MPVLTPKRGSVLPLFPKFTLLSGKEKHICIYLRFGFAPVSFSGLTHLEVLAHEMIGGSRCAFESNHYTTSVMQGLEPLLVQTAYLKMGFIRII